MLFSIEPEIFAKFPNLLVGLIIVNEADNSKLSEDITKSLREIELKLRQQLSKETFKQHPPIASWQEAHRAFGGNPNRDQPSIQALVKRVLNGSTLPSISPLVDAYNLISLKYLVPAGGEDLDYCKGDISLTFAKGGEDFTALGESEPSPAVDKEVVYLDGAGVLCRKFNWRESDRAKLRETTRNAVLVIEALPPINEEILNQALEELAALVSQSTSAKTKLVVLSPDHPRAILS